MVKNTGKNKKKGNASIATVSDTSSQPFLIQSQIESRPAQLSPDIVEKLDKHLVEKIIDNFLESVTYQNETSRILGLRHYEVEKEGMATHYKTIKLQSIYRLTYSFAVILVATIAFYFFRNINVLGWIIGVGIPIPFVPQLFTILQKLLLKKEKQDDPEDS